MAIVFNKISLALHNFFRKIFSFREQELMDSEDKDQNDEIIKSFFSSLSSKGFKPGYGIAYPSDPSETMSLLPMPEIIKDIRQDFVSSSLGECYYDNQANTLTVELAPWVIDWELNLIALTKLTLAKKSFTVRDITLRLTEDPLGIPACTWFIPSQSQIDIGGKLPEDWEFARANIAIQCSNPVLVSPQKYGPCNHFPSNNTCSRYAASQWEVIKTAALENGVQVEFSERYFACQIPKYKVSSPDISGTFHNLDEAEEFFNSLIKIVGQEDLKFSVVETPKKTSNPFFESILANS